MDRVTEFFLVGLPACIIMGVLRGDLGFCLSSIGHFIGYFIGSWILCTTLFGIPTVLIYHRFFTEEKSFFGKKKKEEK